MRLGTSPESGRSAMRVMLTLLLASVVLLAPAAEGPHFAADRPLDMEHIRLELSVDMAQRQVDGVATLRMTPLRSVTSVKLDAVDFDTRAVTLAVDDQAITTPRCANDGQSIEVFLDPPATPGQKLVVTIRYALHDPKSGLHFFAPTSDEPDAPYQVWSQGETSDNRYWIPCLDQPNERQTSEIIATVDAQYQVLSNGRLIAHHAAEEVGQTIYHWVQDKPHPAYLITLVIGKFHVQEERWCDVPITYWVPPERQADVAATFGNTPRMLEFFSDRLGVKYPWDQYAQVCCYQFSGGMENTSATTLAMDTLCDATARLDGGSDPLIAHELAHQWFGDLLTCREWPQLWLNEGFATYFETLWTEYDLGPDEFAYSLYQKAQEALAGDKDGPVVERYYDTTWQLFNPRSYSKGGWILHMLRCQLGDDVFFTALRRYCTTYAGGSVETADFRRTLEETSGRSLGRFFYDWVERPGHPNLDVTYAWHEEDKEAEVVVRQTPTPANDPQARPAEPFQFPLTLELETGPEAAPVVVTQRIAAREATLLVPLPQRPTMVRVDPAYTVLMDLAEHKGRDLWISQLTRDPHPVGRLRALQALVALEKAPRPVTPPLQQAVALAALPATEGLIRDVLADALRTEKFWAVRCELARCVGELGGPAARDALIDALRSEQPRVRTAGLEALRAFRDDATVAAAVRDILVQGDPSERVLSAAATTHAAMSADDTIPLFRTLLERDGQREAVRQRVLKLLGERAEAAGLDLLMEWTPAGRPRACRQTAIAALARAAKQVAAAAPESDVLARLPGVLITALQDDDARVRIAAAHAAAELGPRAAESQEALAAIAAHDPSEAARRAAQEALQKIK